MKGSAGQFEALPRQGRFRFACHAGVACFTDCCRDLHLVLTPYDVARLRRSLGMDASEFLSRYTTTDEDPTWRVPIVKLRMEERAGRPCPFVTERGCRVYEDRPGACRAYPLGRAARRVPSAGPTPAGIEEDFFLVREPHCLGFREGPEWTAESWMASQGLAPYNEMNDLWMAFLSRHRPGRERTLTPEQWRMFFMACYSLDRFRRFVFETRFLRLYAVAEARREEIARSDEALLRFAFGWLAHALCGAPAETFTGGSVDDAGF